MPNKVAYASSSGLKLRRKGFKQITFSIKNKLPSWKCWIGPHLADVSLQSWSLKKLILGSNYLNISQFHCCTVHYFLLPLLLFVLSESQRCKLGLHGNWVSCCRPRESLSPTSWGIFLKRKQKNHLRPRHVLVLLIVSLLLRVEYGFREILLSINNR